MRSLYPQMGLEHLCRLFGKTRQAFYDHERRDGKQQLENGLILDLVRGVKSEMPATGGLKLLEMLGPSLQAHGLHIGRDRFLNLLRDNGLVVRRKRKYARTTWSDHIYRKWPNLIEHYQPTAAGQLWVSDITYVRIGDCFGYLSLVTDAYSRKIVGFHLSQRLKAQGCLIALQKAIKSLAGLKVTLLIHHSDRGVQYCCDTYVDALIQNNIHISMTQSGSPYENAIAERVNGILKTELGLNKVFFNYGHAVDATSKAINLYNSKRLHMSCGNLTPDQAHLKTGQLLKKWKRRRLKNAGLT